MLASSAYHISLFGAFVAHLIGVIYMAEVNWFNLENKTQQEISTGHSNNIILSFP